MLRNRITVVEPAHSRVLNEVLSLNAQECLHVIRLCLIMCLLLNEVLSLNAQE